MMRLFQIPQAIRDLEASLSEDGELTLEDITRIDNLQLELKDRVQAACVLIQEEQSKADIAKQQLARLKALADSHESRSKRWMAYLKHTLVDLKLDHVETDWFDVKLQKNSAPSVITELEPVQLEKQYQREKLEINKEAIVQDWKAGRLLPEGVEVRYGSHVRIR